ncbi:ribonuclease H-like domain-containing protein [Tanacetum coccineum]
MCLGRVLLKKDKVLVLDEAIASVDTATDGMIQQTLNRHFNYSTVIMIAHRITYVLDNDMVLVLEQYLIENLILQQSCWKINRTYVVILRLCRFEDSLPPRLTNDTGDEVTLISKLDISNPLHLHSNDSAVLTVVSIKLKGTENYQVWANAMLLALEGKNKIGFIDGTCKRFVTDDVLAKQWDRVNAVVLACIIRLIPLSKNGSNLSDYYHKLNALWKQFDAMVELPACVCTAADEFKKLNHLMKLMQFLMGLDDSYMTIRSFILSRETLPDVKMEPYVHSCCANCYVVKKRAENTKNQGRTYYSCPRNEPKYGCGYFVWEEELIRCPFDHCFCIARKDKFGVYYKCPMDKKGCGFEYFKRRSNASPSTPGNGSNAEASSSHTSPSTPGNVPNCRSCKVLKLENQMLKAQLDHSQFPSLQELIVGLDEILDDEH